MYRLGTTVLFVCFLLGYPESRAEVAVELPPTVVYEAIGNTLVPLHYLRDHVETAKLAGGFADEYHSIQDGKLKPWTVAEKEVNGPKHRYSSLRAYDETRVVLSPLPNDPDSDYINANWIDSYKKKRAFIATQGPLDETVNDFWRLVWQENVHNIIMAVNIWEHGSQKCAHYWPNNTDSYGGISVTLLKEQTFPFLTFRKFAVEKDDEVREVRHFHFTGWPDMGVPDQPLILVTLLNNAKANQKTCGPILIHCSAGVGRTGTILLLNNALEMAALEGHVDVYKLLQRLRQQRVSLVETVPQYTLVYETLVDVYFGKIPGNHTVAPAS